MVQRLFIQLLTEYAEQEPEYSEFFNKPQLLSKLIYRTKIASLVWFQDFSNWLESNDKMKFIRSKIDPCLFIHCNKDEYLFLIIYINDCCYFGSNETIKKYFEESIQKGFNLELFRYVIIP